MTEPEPLAIRARLVSLRLIMQFEIRDPLLRHAHLLQAVDDGEALLAEVRRLQTALATAPDAGGAG